VSARRTLPFAIAAVVLAAALGYAIFAHQSPDGQPPLAVMDLAGLKADFNRASDRTRVIVLLSPT
jgi:hypothetical protein